MHSGIHSSHAYVLDRLATSLQQFAPRVARAGTSDLVLLGDGGLDSARKISGNSLRVKRTHFLYHGTLLYDFDLPLVAVCLRTAPRQPEYRSGRAHGDFVANLPLERADLESALASAWPTEREATDWPRRRVVQLVHERYSREDWNLA